MQKQPNKIKFFKSHKIKTYKGNKTNSLSFFRSGLKTLNYNYVSFRNYESFRKVYVRAFRSKEIKNKKNFKLIQSSKKKRKRKKPLRISKKKNQLLFKAHFFSSLTKKPLQVRMGKGKGSVYDWIFPCSTGRILFEQLTIIRKKKMKRVFNKALKKMPFSFKYVFDKRKQLFSTRVNNFFFNRRNFFGTSNTEIYNSRFNSVMKLSKKNEQ